MHYREWLMFDQGVWSNWKKIDGKTDSNHRSFGKLSFIQTTWTTELRQ